MLKKNSHPNRKLCFSFAVLLILVITSCTKPPASPKPSVKRIPANQEYAGFLKDYSKLAPNPKLEGNVKTFTQPDARKNIHNYVAVIVDPVEVYLAADADAAKLPEKTRAAVANYFRAALIHAVSDAFPPVDEPGPLVLRLRAAVIGVDAGGAVAAADKPADINEAVDNAANISKVGVEIELLDSVTGDQIAAMVDREPLGVGAEVASTEISRHEKSMAARAAFDEWASRVRLFLNSAHELSEEDMKRAVESYRPYGAPPPAK
jgi:hypothetical protein